jgi:hypothetical protein
MTIRITRLELRNASGPASVFLFLRDPFSFRMYVSADLGSPVSASFQAQFQIFDVNTGRVVKTLVFSSPFDWGDSFWVRYGGANGHTAEEWGFFNQNAYPNHQQEHEIWGFRGIIQVQAYYPRPGGGEPLLDNSAFDVSEPIYFRIVPEAYL